MCTIFEIKQRGCLNYSFVIYKPVSAHSLAMSKRSIPDIACREAKFQRANLLKRACPRTNRYTPLELHFSVKDIVRREKSLKTNCVHHEGKIVNKLWWNCTNYNVAAFPMFSEFIQFPHFINHEKEVEAEQALFLLNSFAVCHVGTNTLVLFSPIHAHFNPSIWFCAHHSSTWNTSMFFYYCSDFFHFNTENNSLPYKLAKENAQRYHAMH